MAKNLNPKPILNSDLISNFVDRYSIIQKTQNPTPNTQLSIINYQLSIINYQLSIINCQL
jgi:hypothetical protein